jgi:hypothetical protein
MTAKKTANPGRNFQIGQLFGFRYLLSVSVRAEFTLHLIGVQERVFVNKKRFERPENCQSSSIHKQPDTRTKPVSPFTQFTKKHLSSSNFMGNGKITSGRGLKRITRKNIQRIANQAGHGHVKVIRRTKRQKLVVTSRGRGNNSNLDWERTRTFTMVSEAQILF